MVTSPHIWSLQSTAVSSMQRIWAWPLRRPDLAVLLSALDSRALQFSISFQSPHEIILTCPAPLPTLCVQSHMTVTTHRWNLTAPGLRASSLPPRSLYLFPFLSNRYAHLFRPSPLHHHQARILPKQTLLFPLIILPGQRRHSLPGLNLCRTVCLSRYLRWNKWFIANPCHPPSSPMLLLVMYGVPVLLAHTGWLVFPKSVTGPEKPPGSSQASQVPVQSDRCSGKRKEGMEKREVSVMAFSHRSQVSVQPGGCFTGDDWLVHQSISRGCEAGPGCDTILCRH
ncbi:hypothetical protein B0T20DRAFT_216580 [Sordaria brevicollis]|uniref:Uncharacterized protein n=1 Tax=Sordaria brevicollis TaxID=83679 RepID=A0AAE0UC51_SORBR|nr:hypothetical protein B0T20DRAFT_216580 [Sordaria brevicollis]